MPSLSEALGFRLCGSRHNEAATFKNHGPGDVRAALPTNLGGIANIDGTWNNKLSQSLQNWSFCKQSHRKEWSHTTVDATGYLISKKSHNFRGNSNSQNRDLMKKTRDFVPSNRGFEPKTDIQSSDV